MSASLIVSSPKGLTHMAGAKLGPNEEEPDAF